jgi:hypothetical protein
MLSLEIQKRAEELLRKLDQAVTDDLDLQSTLREYGRSFRDYLYQSFEFIHNKSLPLNEIDVKIQRIDSYQFTIEPSKGPSFRIFLDEELAYDSKPATQQEGGESAEKQEKQRWMLDLAVRIFVIFESPQQGLLRYYTIFPDGLWKRTVFTLGANGVTTQSVIVPQFSHDVVAMETLDLLKSVYLLRPSWANVAPIAETCTLNQLKDRTVVKHHLTGLGAPRLTT